MTLAALLVFRFKGSGIAFALSFASAVNTAALLYFLRKNPAITLGRTLKSAMGYALKLILFSAIATVPVLLLSPRLSEIFAGSGRIISQGAPFFINALVFAAIGIILLAATKDRHLLGIINLVRTSRKDL